MSEVTPPEVELDSHPIEAEPNIEELFRFDPFSEQGPEPDAAPEVATEAAATPTEDIPSTASVEPAVAPSAPPVTDHAAQLARASELLAGLVQRQMTAPAQAPPPAAAVPDEEDIPAFNFNLPAEIVDALYGDDPVVRAQALNALFRGVARVTYRQARDDQKKYIEDTVVPSIRQQAIQEVERRAVVNDFYGTYPQLNTPGLRALVVEELPNAARELGAQGWNPALKQRVYERVVARVQSVIPQVPKPDVPARAVPAPAPAVRGSNARPASGPPSRDDIASVLGF